MAAANRLGKDHDTDRYAGQRWHWLLAAAAQATTPAISSRSHQIQHLNRYSYVFNNPLSYTDPSGFSAWGKYRNTVVAVILAVLSWWCNGCAAAPYLAAISMLRTFYVANKAGSLDGAVKGAFVNWAIGFVIQYFYGFNPNQNIVTATVVGGTASRLTGGSFSNGAQSSAFSWALNWSVGKVMEGMGVKQMLVAESAVQESRY